jgi:serine/threonine protein kinase/tetratricopeptide (TPR) repeat protein
METNGLPADAQKRFGLNSSDSTLKDGSPGAVATAQIGPYHLMQVVGEGGMGEVWLAEQKTPMHRTVALKLIKAGMDTKAVVARFESERQALALMDHPNIAQVYDGGSTPEGRPYFVMEYVPGLPITEYCDKHCLTMRERVELFLQVCDGVQHAHQKAIMHRDLKPSNVLVVERNDKAVPKIIDFGLAKAMGQRLTDKTMFTEMGVLVGTPEYMSPEQADLVEQNVDTRTDVYSLGVILYELLVGALPFDAKTLRAAGLEGILRVIREQEPPKPSTKVRLMGESSAASAEKRKEELRSFARHLQGELDWITLKALDKDRARRYGTVSELSADLSRYLHDEPVVAGPATAAYRVRKYAARHRFGLGVAAAALVLLSGFVVAQAVELRRIRAERDRADRERDRANRITDFMTGMFKVSNPGEARGNNITAREILDKASAEIEVGLSKDPGLQAQLIYNMAIVHENLGLFPIAEAQLNRTIEIRRRTLGSENANTLMAMDSLAFLLHREGQFARADSMERQTVALERKLLGAENQATLSAMNNLGVILLAEGHRDEAAQLDRETADLERRVLGPDALLTLSTLNNLAMVLRVQGRLPEAEKTFRQVYESRTRVLGPEHPDTLTAQGNFALVLADQGRFLEAEKLDREILEKRLRILGPEHPDTLYSGNNLADVLISEGKYPEAEKLDRETLETRRRVLGPEHPDTVISMSNLGRLLASEGHAQEAEKLFAQIVDVRKRVLGLEHPDTVKAMADLSAVLGMEHKYAESEKLGREALELGRRVLGEKDTTVAILLYNLGALAGCRGRNDEALALLDLSLAAGLPLNDVLNMAEDPDLKPLHRDPRFAALVAHAKEVAVAQKPR